VEVIVDASTGNGLSKRSAIRLDQIRTIDARRIVKHLGSVAAITMCSVDDAIRISLGLVEL
jgi:mRNA-degrading endonuclease toxin of MazEF toxin-antitoxin module